MPIVLGQEDHVIMRVPNDLFAKIFIQTFWTIILSMTISRVVIGVKKEVRAASQLK
jgi:hypothetical protein